MYLCDKYIEKAKAIPKRIYFIIVYKNSKEVAKEIGVTSKSDIYSLIKKEI